MTTELIIGAIALAGILGLATFSTVLFFWRPKK